MLRLLTYGLMTPNKMLGSHRVPWTLVSSGWNPFIQAFLSTCFLVRKLSLFFMEISLQCVFLPVKHVSYTSHLYKLKLSKVAYSQKDPFHSKNFNSHICTLLFICFRQWSPLP